MNIDNIRSERQLKASIGFSITDFKHLSALFEAMHEDIYGISLKEKFINLGKKPLLSTGKEVVFFVLFQLKNSLSYDVLGAIFHTDASHAHRNCKQYLPLVRKVLFKLSLLPARELTPEVLSALLPPQAEATTKDVYIDATEVPVQRPINHDAQRKLYSGKGIA